MIKTRQSESLKCESPSMTIFLPNPRILAGHNFYCFLVVFSVNTPALFAVIQRLSDQNEKISILRCKNFFRLLVSYRVHVFLQEMTLCIIRATMSIVGHLFYIIISIND